MIKEPTVLVLGAGASAPYGLPVGAALRRQILEMTDATLSSLPIGQGKTRTYGAAPSFREAFRRSRYYSIDAFLGRRNEFADLGRHAIAATLLPQERLDSLVDLETEDDWYSYLLHAMDAPWDDFARNQIAFVTFNYDRSLELCLQVALMHRYGRTESEAWEMVQRFPIVHVYGSLGSLDPRASDFVPYGGASGDRSCLLTAAAGIQVIDEARDDSPSFARARELLDAAARQVFLGFAFDPTNVRRLGGISVGAGAPVRRENGVTMRRFAATAFGLTEAQRNAAAEALTIPSFRPNTGAGMLDMKSLALLKHTLILEAT